MRPARKEHALLAPLLGAAPVKSVIYFGAELMVRIHLPPAESPCLARFCPPTARSRLFVRVCGPGRCSAVSRDGYRAMHGADRREYLCRAKFQYRGVDAAVA